jgi:hypothetical protein
MHLLPVDEIGAQKHLAPGVVYLYTHPPTLKNSFGEIRGAGLVVVLKKC